MWSTAKTDVHRSITIIFDSSNLNFPSTHGSNTYNGGSGHWTSVKDSAPSRLLRGRLDVATRLRVQSTQGRQRSRHRREQTMGAQSTGESWPQTQVLNSSFQALCPQCYAMRRLQQTKSVQLQRISQQSIAGQSTQKCRQCSSIICARPTRDQAWWLWIGAEMIENEGRC